MLSKWLDLSGIATLLDQPTQNVASAPTIDVTPYAATTRNLLITGSTQIDGWAITAGQVFVVKFSGSLSLTNNVNQVTGTGGTIKVGPNDSCIVRATANNIVEIILFAKPGATLVRNFHDFRLSLVSGTPVPTVDTNSATLYLAPYSGNKIALFNGSTWIVRESNEVSLAIAGLTITRPYDVFCYDNAGVPALELLIWTSATVRATALTTQDGVLVKSGDATRKYVGTVVPTAAAQLTDSERQRLVWNYYNRVQTHLRRQDPVGSWTYAVASTVRQANANVLNQIEVANGLLEDSIAVDLTIVAANNGAAGSCEYQAGIGRDTVAGSSGRVGSVYNTGVNFRSQVSTSIREKPAIGYHYYTWLEYQSAGTTTYTGAQYSELNAVWRA
jgi:hypothetical protein